MFGSTIALLGSVILLLIAFSSHAQQAEAPVYKDGDWWRVKVDVVRPPGVSIAGPQAGGAQRVDEVEIRTNTATTRELQGKDQFVRLLHDYPLKPYLFTKVVLIQSGVIPHSHPVLTLNTRYLDNDIAQLATFVHEQLHWFLVEQVGSDRVDAAIARLRILFPEAPDRPPAGANGSHSTYLHLIVCTLELEAVSSLVGRNRARDQLATWKHYTWVYGTVLSDSQRIIDVMTVAGIPLVTSRPAGSNTR
jgi:hypothetical protein